MKISKFFDVILLLSVIATLGNPILFFIMTIRAIFIARRRGGNLLEYVLSFFFSFFYIMYDTFKYYDASEIKPPYVPLRSESNKFIRYTNPNQKLKTIVQQTQSDLQNQYKQYQQQQK